jgi:hypothetical protein
MGARTGARGRRAHGAVLLLGMLAASCAAAGSEIHLEPLYSRYSTGDGATEVEALAGLWLRREGTPGPWEVFPELEGEYESRTFGPFWGLDQRPDGSWMSRFLVPLGLASSRQGEAFSMLIPFYLWTREDLPEGGSEWRLATLPGFLMRSTEDTTEVGWFPFVGRFQDVFTFDRIVFVLWPLFVYAERGEAVSYHFLWPFVGWTRGGGESSFHVFPFYGRARIEGRYDRNYFLWPIFHVARNHLGGGGEEPAFTWWIFPLIGHTQRGTFEAYTWLWPFFGWSHDSRSGFWALDFPWPLVRLQRGPDDVSRTRVWPLFSHSVADGLDAWSFLWPIVHLRHEDMPSMRRRTFYVIPFWQSWNRTDLDTGETSSWRKLFPVFMRERQGTRTRASFPTLDPLLRYSLMDRHFAWLWKLWEWQTDEDMRRERSWGGIWRRERDAAEERTSLSGLWARREYRADEREVRETSLLFGLVRWRVTEGQGFDMLPLAFPGPGWPARRVRGPEDQAATGAQR